MAKKKATQPVRKRDANAESPVRVSMSIDPISGELTARLKSSAGTSAANPTPFSMYPVTEPISLQVPSRLIDYHAEANEVVIEGAEPPQVRQLREHARHQVDFNARMKQYASACCERILQYLTEEQIDSIARLNAPIRLPDSAPGSAHDALLALRFINRISELLCEIGDWDDRIDVAFCHLIDLGQLLQRSQTQLDFTNTVQSGEIVKQARKKGTGKTVSKKQSASEDAWDHFRDLMIPHLVRQGYDQQSLRDMKRKEFVTAAKRTRMMTTVMQHVSHKVDRRVRTLKSYLREWSE